jgi:hypothetical protein
MTGFIGTSLQLHLIITAHTLNPSERRLSDEPLWRISDWSNFSNSESESYVTTDGQSASLSWNKAPIWGLQPDFYYRRTFAGLLMWGALSDGRTGLSFTIAAGLASAIILWSEPLWTRDHILLSQIWDFPFRRLLRLAGPRMNSHF